SVEKQIWAKDLAVEFLALEHPHQDEKDDEFRSGLEKLRRFARYEGIGFWRREQVFERHSPPMIGWFTVAAAGREAAHAADGVTYRETGCEGIAGSERGHPVFSEKPPCDQERCDQLVGKDSSGLQCVEA